MSKGNRSEQIIYGFFTLNEADEEKLPAPETFISKFKEAEPYLDYVKFQLEQGEAKARNHYQGVFHLSARRASVKFKSNLTRVGLGRLHFERARNWLACLEYVSKLRSRIGGPWHSGTPPQDPRSGFKRNSSENQYPPRADPMARREVWLTYGPPGCGKTYEVREYCKQHKLDLYTIPDRAKQSSGRWIGKYTGQPAVLFDEFKPKEFALNTWKLLLDSYDINVTTSMGGQTAMWQPSHIFLVTNNDHGEAEWMLSQPSLLRRITLVRDYYETPPPYSKPEDNASEIFQETEDESSAPWPEDPSQDYQTRFAEG